MNAPTNALDIDTVRLGESHTGRYRTDLPLITFYALPEHDEEMAEPIQFADIELDAGDLELMGLGAYTELLELTR